MKCIHSRNRLNPGMLLSYRQIIFGLSVVPQGSVIEDSETEVTKVNEIVRGKKNTEVAQQLLGLMLATLLNLLR